MRNIYCRVTKQAAVPSFLEGGDSGIKSIDLTAPWRFESFSYSFRIAEGDLVKYQEA